MFLVLQSILFVLRTNNLLAACEEALRRRFRFVCKMQFFFLKLSKSFVIPSRVARQYPAAILFASYKQFLGEGLSCVQHPRVSSGCVCPLREGNSFILVVVLCSALLCHALPCHALPCPAMPHGHSCKYRSHNGRRVPEAAPRTCPRPQCPLPCPMGRAARTTDLVTLRRRRPPWWTLRTTFTAY